MAARFCSQQEWLQYIGEQCYELHRIGLHPMEKWGQFNGPRVLDVHWLFCCADQDAQLTVQGKQHQLARGTLVWIAAGVSHEVRLLKPGPAKRVYRMQLRVGPELDCDPTDGDGYVLARDAQEVLPMYEQLHREWVDPGPHSQSLCAAVLQQISIAAFRLAAPRSKEGGLSLVQRRGVLELVHQRRSQALQAADLAAALDLNPRHFARRFKVSFGTAPRSWLVNERMRFAAQMLIESDAAVASVAASVGATDPYLFSRQFHSVLGCSPSTYRKRHR